MLEYIQERVWGIDASRKRGGNTRYKHTLPPYVHEVTIRGTRYFKVHMRRGGEAGKSKIKYFKTKADAIMFTDMLRLNPYL